eukprot:gb/GEZJ01000677.1/.p1 GENE.gb/GEZJ01000677.1/~~gb/GEZJ01000677.1/.p1  ORF type:complete len:265 (-),score=14.52 gb/GEZJ01000677.1/:167-961(-)
MFQLNKCLSSRIRRFPRPKCTSSAPYALVLCIILLSFQLLFISPTSCHQRKPTQSLITILEQWQRPYFARKNLRIFVYDIPPAFNKHLVQQSIRNPSRIRDPRCDTNFYSSEVHVHRFFLNSPFRTTSPKKADFFYVPIYTTCDLIQHQPNDVDRVGRNFENAMNWVIHTYPFWNYSSGRDHVYIFSQGFSARLAGNWPKYSNGIFMVHNGEFTAPEYTPHKDITIPPELRAYLQPYWTTFHGTNKDYAKKYLAQFGGQVIDHR